MTLRTSLLFAPVDAAPLAAFRILFGALMAFEAFGSYLHKVPERYSPDMFHFTYAGFHWVAPPPGFGIYLLIVAMGLAAFFLTIGYHYRIAALVYFLSYTYLFLIEASTYNNHYYLIILLAFLFVVVDAHRDASIDAAKLPPGERGWVPSWQIYLFRTQIVLVYFFGGVAKLNADWLRLHPVAEWLEWRAETTVLGPILTLPVTPYIFAYGGMIFDLSIGFLLLWRRTRPVAIALVLFFHLTNATLFTIGVFPWLGIGATVLFLEGQTVRRMLHRLGYAPASAGLPERAAPGRRRWVMTFCALYLAIQLVLPFRHWYYPGNVSWTEKGHALAWHMKLRNKEGAIRFIVQDRKTGERQVVDEEMLAADLKAGQIYILPGRPAFIRQFARYLREKYIRLGFGDPAVFAETLVSLNGRPYQAIVDPTTDLASSPALLWECEEWIVPLDPALEPGNTPPMPKFDEQQRVGE